jgi:hypothetical protein
MSSSSSSLELLASTSTSGDAPARGADVARLYLAFSLMGLALSVVTAGQFIDMILLRIGLNMQQFGIIKGLGLWLPMTANLLLAPIVLRLDIDRWIASVGHLVRVGISFVFLVLPNFTRDPSRLTTAYTITFVVWMIFPILANNSLFVLCREVLPREQLGRHMSYITALWTLPGPFAATIAGVYVQRHAGGTDDEFFRAMFWAFFWTSVFMLPSSYLMSRIRPRQRSAADLERTRKVRMSIILDPFRSAEFRAVLNLIFALSTLTAMVTSFMYPYLLQAQRMTLWQIGILDAALAALGIGIAGALGRLVDRFGAGNTIRISAIGLATGLFFFTGHGWLFVILYATLAWGSERGIFGTGNAIAQRYLMLSQGDPTRSHVYLAATTFVTGCGYLVGGVGGGWLLQWLAARVRTDLPFEHFRIYFTVCALLYLLMGDLIARVREDRRRVSSVEMAIEMARALRGLATRSR